MGQTRLKYHIFTDIIICGILLILIFLFKDYFEGFIKIPNRKSIDSFSITLISLGATFIGFIMTILTVLITFKNAYVKNDQEILSSYTPKKDDGIPEETVFDKKVSKKDQFYGSTIHKDIMEIFINSSIIIGVVLVVNFLIMLNLFQNTSTLIITYLVIGSFILLLLSIIRCYRAFRFFLNIHV